MSNRRLLQGLLSGLAVLLLVSASALAKGSRAISVPYAAVLAGTHIDAGHYQLTWEQHSPEATVTLAQGRAVVATAQGKVVERDVKYERNMVVFDSKADGSQVITEIRLGGTNQAIVFSE